MYVGTADRVIHTPADGQQLPGLMEDWFAFRDRGLPCGLVNACICHFYFVYLHPFCDGNGRMARILNASQLYHSGFAKMKTVSLSNAINAQLSGYYSGLTDSEQVLEDGTEHWLDLSPFVAYMMNALERGLMDAALSVNRLSEPECRILERMNKAGSGAELSLRKAAEMLRMSEGETAAVLNGLTEKGYLAAPPDGSPGIYRLRG